jgi:hypothetical protein
MVLLFLTLLPSSVLTSVWDASQGDGDANDPVLRDPVLNELMIEVTVMPLIIKGLKLSFIQPAMSQRM